jgi:putative peptide zinc metalloprotease protein
VTTLGDAAERPTEPPPGPLRRADGVELIGEMAGSGYRVPPFLVRRGDGQTLQLSPLLFATLEAIDGRRDGVEVAEEVSRRTGRTVSPDNVTHLVHKQLRPLGLLLRADGSQPEVRRSNPLLGLRFRYAVTDPVRTRRLTAPFAVLFRPFIVAPVVTGFLALCWWVLFEKGLASATYEAFEHPGLLLLVFVVTVLSGGFHEFGHAAAARYGGATPGVMGAGLYLVWPAFYTDVTDSYRLGRAGRLRTDLGGLYFNAIVAVAVTAWWWATGYDALLLVVATQILQMLRQLLPLVRFDGYHVLADLTGVPDLFHRIGPTLLSVLPWRRDPEAELLKPWVRVVVTLWVAVVVPLLLLAVALMVLALPRVLATAFSQLQRRRELLGAAWAGGDMVQAAAQVLTIVAITLPVLAVLYLLARLGRQLVTAAWRATAGRPFRRAVASAVALAVLAGLAWAWWPGGDTYRPIQPSERGTVVDAVTSVASTTGLASRAAVDASGLAAGQTGTTHAVWDTRTPLPARNAPHLAVVMIPREGGGQPAGETWVFPFDRPLAPGPGDNQALAVNTEDGTVVYDTAFALVWVEDGESALNTNEAYALASCRSCAAVAIAFQVVLVVGDTDVAVPQNLAGALNYRCVNCLTYALAKQLFLTVDEPLSRRARTELDRLWRDIAAFGADIARVPLEQVADQLDTFEAQIRAIIARDQPRTPDATPTPTSAATTTTTPTTEPSSPATPSPSRSSTASPTTSTSPTPTPSTSPTPTPTAEAPEASASPTATDPVSSPAATSSPAG